MDDKDDDEVDDDNDDDDDDDEDDDDDDVNDDVDVATARRTVTLAKTQRIRQSVAKRHNKKGLNTTMAMIVWSRAPPGRWSERTISRTLSRCGTAPQTRYGQRRRPC